MTGFNHLLSPEKSEKDLVSFCPAVKRSGVFPLFLLCNSILKRIASRTFQLDVLAAEPKCCSEIVRADAAPTHSRRDSDTIKSKAGDSVGFCAEARRGEARRVAKSVCQEREKRKNRKNTGNQRLPALPSSRSFICLTQDSGGKKLAAECQNPSLRKSHSLSTDGWAAERSCACLSSVSPLPGDAGRGRGGGGLGW